MPNIWKCNGEGCPLKQTCWRFLAVDSEFRQSYFVTQPIKNGKCDQYWKVELKYETKIKLNRP